MYANLRKHCWYTVLTKRDNWRPDQSRRLRLRHQLKCVVSVPTQMKQRQFSDCTRKLQKTAVKCTKLTQTCPTSEQLAMDSPSLGTEARRLSVEKQLQTLVVLRDSEIRCLTFIKTARYKLSAESFVRGFPRSQQDSYFSSFLDVLDVQTWAHRLWGRSWGTTKV